MTCCSAAWRPRARAAGRSGAGSSSRSAGSSGSTPGSSRTPRAGAKAPVVWCVAVLIDKKPYLFDPRIGLPIPDARGDGVATLEEALTDPAVLDRMDLHIAGQPAYGTTRDALLASPTQDRHPDRLEPPLLLAPDEAPPAEPRGQEPDDPLPRPGRAARPVRRGARPPARQGHPLGPADPGRDPALHQPPVRRVDAASPWSSSGPSSRCSTPG